MGGEYENWAVFVGGGGGGGLDLSRDFFGIFKSFVVVPVYHGRVVGSSANKVQHVMSFNAFWKFLRLGNSACDFLGVNFWSREFFLVLLKALGIFWGLDFCPHSIIPVT